MKKEKIFRLSQEKHYSNTFISGQERESYPWEEGYVGPHPKISKEDFRCRGEDTHPPKTKPKEEGALLYDCGGRRQHSLPVREGKEFVYPILLDLLNYIQAQTGCAVVVTCGHRCPAHNTYADSSLYNVTSKHMLGAEVDFYVRGKEHRAEEIVDVIMRYYQTNAVYGGAKEYVQFQRLDRGKLDVKTAPWYNKEVLIKLYKVEEGRDLDNSHSHPYLSIQVRFDRQTGEKVIYSWEKAFNGYMRY